MLQSLHIENIAVIRRLDAECGEGFHALTGETGAGKSILIDSIRLLLGERADRELIRTGESRAMVSALFRVDAALAQTLRESGVEPDENRELLLQRTLDTEGHSSARINGRSVNVSLLREIGRQLVCIHGQHDSVRLLDEDSHLEMLDGYGKTAPLLQEYALRYRAVTKAKAELEALLREEKDAAGRAEMLRYQIGEIDALHLKAGEEFTLTEQKKKLRDAEKLMKNCRIIRRALWQNEKGGSAITLLTAAKEAILGLGECWSDREATTARLDGICAELEEIALRADALCEWEGEPSVLLGEVEDRLAAIDRLDSRYGGGKGSEGILRYREQCVTELRTIENHDALLSEAKKKLSRLAGEAKTAAEALRQARLAAAGELERRVKEELSYLDLGKVDFRVEVAVSTGKDGNFKLLPNGMDAVRFLLATGPGEPLRPLAKIASGGELSRIMLALKTVFSDKDRAEALIFDEIDTGVSGKTAEKIGRKLRELGKTAQVFCVTHSAQVAARADRHYLIRKEEVEGRNETTLTPLDEAGRLAELSRIIGGIEITETIKETAWEMLRGQG